MFLSVMFFALAAALFIACKKESNDGTSVGYAQDKGTGANPNTTH